MTLPDGSTIEISAPSLEDGGQDDVHGYRVGGAEGVAEFSTLLEVVASLSADLPDPVPE